MKQHQYKITIEHLADANGNLVNDPKLIFNAPNHDNIFDIVAKMQASSDRKSVV